MNNVNETTKIENESRNAFYQGQILNNKYILLKIIGSGAYADVWLALDYIPNKCYAIKIHEEGYYDVAKKELNILKNLNAIKSKNTTQIVADFVHDDLTFEEAEDSDIDIEYDQYLCLVFELMGGTAYDLIKTGTYAHGLPVPIVKSVIKDILRGLVELNKVGMCHTDIKPENTLISGYGKYIKIVNYITEFNFAKRHSDNMRITINKTKSKKINRKKIANDSILYVAKTLISQLEPLFEEFMENKEEIEHNCNKYQSRNRTCFYSDNYSLVTNNISCKLGDVGSSEDARNIKHEIHTRYYKSPESILQMPINIKCDVWSIGCSIYELLTGEIFFEPEKQVGFSRNRHHLNDIQKIFGIIPDYIKNKSPIKQAFFKQDGGMKNKVSCGHTPLTKILKKKLALSNPDYYDTEDFYCLCDLLYKIFDYDNDRRISAKECLEHKWLN